MFNAAINIKNQQDDKVDKDLSYGLSIILLVICFVKIMIVPIVIIYFHKRGELYGEKRQQRCGVAFGDLSHEIRAYWAVLFPLFSNLRLVLLVYVTLYMEDFLML